MSWQTADLLSADTTDVLAADTTDVLAADTTDVLSADTSLQSGKALRCVALRCAALRCAALRCAALRCVAQTSLVSEPQHLRIIFEVLDLHLGCLVLEAHFPRKCSKNTVFYTVWEPAWYTKADPPDPPDQADQADQAEMVHGRQLGP